MECVTCLILLFIAGILFFILLQQHRLNADVENERLRAQIQNLEKERDSERQEKESAVRELQNVREQLRVECRERRDVDHQYQRAKSNYRELCEIKEIADAKCKLNKMRGMEEKVRSLEQELTHKIWDLHEAQNETKNAEVEKQALEMKIKRVTERIKRFELEHGFFVEQFCIVSKENRRLKMTGNDRINRAALAEKERNEAKRKVGRLRLKWTKEKQKLEKRLACVLKRLALSIKRIIKLKKQIKSLTTDLAKVTQLVRGLQDDNENLRRDVARLVERREEDKKQRETLEEILTNSFNHQEHLKEKMCMLKLHKRSAEEKIKELTTRVVKAESVTHHDCYHYLRKREMILQEEKETLEKKLKQQEERMRKKEEATCLKCPKLRYKYRLFHQKFIKLRRKHAMHECNISILALLLIGICSPVFFIKMMWAVCTEVYFSVTTRTARFCRKIGIKYG